jgi:hypothetical protein
VIREAEARTLAEEWFQGELADWIRLERADFGWIARVEEPPIGPGDVIGQPVLALGPGHTDVRNYPAMPSAQIRQQHLAWLENVANAPDVVDGPESFT